MKTSAAARRIYGLKKMLPSHEESPGDFNTGFRLLILSVMAVVVGSFGAAAAWALQRLINIVTNFAYTGMFSDQTYLISSHPLGPWSVLIPTGGCLLIGLMARYGSEKIRGHGIPEAIEAILIGKSRIQPKVALLKPLSSALSIGTGGPFGAEGPIIMTGGALGSIFAQMFHLSSAERKTLLVAGAAAGMSATFNTPVAAMLLAVELLLFEWKPRSFIPVSIAAAVAAAWRPWLIGAGALFPVSAAPLLPWYGLFACAALGVLSGLFSGLLTQMVYKCEDFFQSLPVHWMWWPVAGGLVIGLGGLIEPRALGVGYDNIALLLQGGMSAHDALRLVGVKAVIWAVALGSGTSGGVLAPLLMMGGALGALFSGFVHTGTPAFWALIAMAAVMSGTMRSPLTASIFALELTHDVGALLPLAVACTLAQGTTVLLLRRSILTEKIARRGNHVFREYIVDPFETIRVEDIMTQPPDTLPETMSFREASALLSIDSPALHPGHYPVMNDNGRAIGIVSRADILRWMVENRSPDTLLKNLVARPVLVEGYTQELTGRLADRMISSGVSCAPILQKKGGALAGIVTRGDLLQVRANFMNEEKQREILIPVTRRKRRRPDRRS